MKLLIIVSMIFTLNSFAGFSDKKVDMAFMQKLFINRNYDALRSWYRKADPHYLMNLLRQDSRKLQQFANFEKRMISWVNFLDASESNDLFSSKMIKWRQENEGCSQLILIKAIENEMKKYDEKTQGLLFFLFVYRPDSIFSNGDMFYFQTGEVEGTRSFDSGSFQTYHYSEFMNAITRNFSWLMRFSRDSRPDMVEFHINHALKLCDRLPSQEEFFPNWDMEEINYLMSIADKVELKNQLELFMSSAWAPEMSFKYAYSNALALYPYLGIKFNNVEKTPEFTKTYFDSMVTIYDRADVIDEKLCRSLNGPLSLASMLGFDVDPLEREYSLFSAKDFEKWMEIKGSVSLASMYGLKECQGTLGYLNNVWGGSTIFPHARKGEAEVQLYYYPKWKTNISIRSKLEQDGQRKFVKKSKLTGRFGRW